MYKLFFTSLCILICIGRIQGQTLAATYTVVQQLNVPNGLNNTIQKSIKYTGYLFKKDSRYMYFEKPQYLKDYPDSILVVQGDDFHTGGYRLIMDTIQDIKYCHKDSLLLRFRQNFSFELKSFFPKNVVQNFEADFYSWKLLNDTKVINGLKCQKAVFDMFGGNKYYEVWFCKDIPAYMNIKGFIGVPGLVVEAYNILENKYYFLNSHAINVEIKEEIFWPNEFNESFTHWPVLSRKNIDKNKSKFEKLVEIGNSNQ